MKDVDNLMAALLNDSGTTFEGIQHFIERDELYLAWYYLVMFCEEQKLNPDYVTMRDVLERIKEYT